MVLYVSLDSSHSVKRNRIAYNIMVKIILYYTNAFVLYFCWIFAFFDISFLALFYITRHYNGVFIGIRVKMRSYTHSFKAAFFVEFQSRQIALTHLKSYEFHIIFHLPCNQSRSNPLPSEFREHCHICNITFA